MKSLLITAITTAFLWGGVAVADDTLDAPAYTYALTLGDQDNPEDTADFVESSPNTAFLDENPYGLIADAQNVVQDYSRLPNQIRAPGERVFIFSPRILRWAAYDADGYLVASGKANGGAAFCANLGRPCQTPVGSFRISRKGDASCVSSRFPLPTGGAPMPYCMFFSGGNAIHGSPYISNRNTSHGCIRVYPGAAAWLSHYFMRAGTKVIVLPY
ncbi:hypothetical protein AYO24_01955 [Coxiella burnetii]|uniref:L,D-transpeptidase n=1 Tax=Coxiella burnetii TaxID=777 RepID=UPI000C048C2E|nr:L,D-transpeptidase [Coxiella burnetii]ATN81541.1 hypothetical protein AYO24_01955 [Coxiella burnetii]